MCKSSVPENLNVKKTVLSEIERYTPSHAVLASSTSSIPISETQVVLRKPERSIIVHPINPPHLISAVEVVPGAKTSKETIEATCSFMKSLGKVPVLLKKETPGFIANRLCAAMYREAISLVERSVASVEDIDKLISEGLGLRWSLMDQFEVWHIGGGRGGLRMFHEKLGHMVESVYADLDKSSLSLCR